MPGWRTYCNGIKNFQVERDRLVNERDTALKAIAPYEGSEGYTQQEADIQRRYHEGMEAARYTARQVISASVEAMIKDAYKTPLSVPDAESLAVLQVLKMREHLTKEEIDNALPMMKGNALAMGVLSELAKKNEIPFATSYYSSHAVGFDRTKAVEAVKNMRDSGFNFINRDGHILSAYVASEYQKEHYGNETAVGYEPTYTDEDACIRTFSGLSDVSAFKQEIRE